MNILITGGRGYIGQYLAQYFKNEQVTITTRKITGKNQRCMELLEEASIVDICKNMDIVIHTASMDERQISGHERDTLLVNAYATRALYEDAVKHHVKLFVYLSTFHVYGKMEAVITEENKTEPVNDYGLTHLFAEQYLKLLSGKYKVPVSVVRLTNGIGLPGEGVDKWYLALNDFCKTACNDKKIVLKSNGLPRRDFIAIKDICSAIDLLIKKGNREKYEIYNVSTQKTYSIRELAYLVIEKYQKLSGEKVEFTVPEVSQKEIEEVIKFEVSSDKLRQLGWIPKESVESIIENILTTLLDVERATK